jgi:hydrogenase expression/formation protein HypE
MDGDIILLAHGSGGRLTHELIRDVFVTKFDNPMLNKLDDSAVFQLPGDRVAFTTDSYVVDPLFFRGGDIGKLAVCGTVNDLSMSGARPLYLTCSFIIEEGLAIENFKTIVDSIMTTSKAAGVKVVGGDTKVVGKGNADKLFVNTSGIGVIEKGVDISGSNAKAGDAVLVSGGIGEHGIAVMSAREGLEFEVSIGSDCAPLNGLVADMIRASQRIHCLRDLTRGGLATALNEIALQSGVGFSIEEKTIPVHPGVRGACELLGLDPLYVACEGRCIVILPREDAGAVLEAMRRNPLGGDASIIGEVIAEPSPPVRLRTEIGGTRIVDMLRGEQLPRIC